MPISLESEHLNGVKVLALEAFNDERGFFMELYREDQFRKLGLPTKFVQDNLSHSVRNVVRGLHFQWDPPVGKLMRVVAGSAFLVAVDIRKGSPTLGRWHGIEVAAGDNKQVWAPEGFARGFCVTSDVAEIEYKCTGIYNVNGQSGIRWNDPAIGVRWPVTNPILSGKDGIAQTFEQWLASPTSDKFQYR